MPAVAVAEGVPLGETVAVAPAGVSPSPLVSKTAATANPIPAPTTQTAAHFNDSPLTNDRNTRANRGAIPLWRRQYSAASSRESEPSLERISLTWYLAPSSETPSAAAISGLVFPREMR